MNARPKTLMLVCAGMALALGVGEMSLRLAPDLVSDSWYWPIPEAEVKYRQLSEDGRNPDVVLLGSSFVEAAIDPGQMVSDFEVYNLAMPFTTTQTMEVWLDQVVFVMSDPEVVVIGVSVWEDPAARDSDISAGLSSAIARSAGEGESRFNLWELRGALGLMDRSLARDRLTSASLWTEFGHQTAYQTQNTIERPWPERSASAIGAIEESGLKRLIDLAHRESPHVVILVEPLASSIAPDPAATDALVAILREVARSSGALLWEAPGSFWSDDNFVDGIHFDEEATTLFSEYINDKLNDLGRNP